MSHVDQAKSDDLYGLGTEPTPDALSHKTWSGRTPDSREFR